MAIAIDFHFMSSISMAFAIGDGAHKNEHKVFLEKMVL